jgi:hypothetical protein
MIDGAAANVVSQGVNIAIGVQEKFSWKQVAASAVAAPAANWAGNKVSTSVFNSTGSKFVTQLTTGLATGTINQVAYAAFTGGRVDYTRIVADAFGNAIGNSISDRIDYVSQRNAIARNLADRIGVDIRDPRARDVLRRAAAAQLDPNVSTDTLRGVTSDYLRLAGASDQELQDTMALYEQELFRRDDIWTRPLDQFTSTDEDTGPSTGGLHITITGGNTVTPVFGSPRVDNLVIGAGAVTERVVQFIDERPSLKYALIGLDIAAGPAAFAVRTTVMATPVGELVHTAQAAMTDYLTEQFAEAGYHDDQATHGGGGAMGLGSLAVLGAAGAIKALRAAGIGNRLVYMGRTPGKASPTGLAVQARMREAGTLRDTPDGPEFQASDKVWYPLREADMAHVTNAVTWWNQTGRFFGARSPLVRQWMLEPNNYTLEHYSINRSQGALLRETYLPPATGD